MLSGVMPQSQATCARGLGYLDWWALHQASLTQWWEGTVSTSTGKWLPQWALHDTFWNYALKK